MTTKISYENKALVPLWGVLKKRGKLKYHIDLVASADYGKRPWYRFESFYVFIDVNTGVVQFRAPVNSVNQFIWNIIYHRSGSSTPVGEYVDVYIKGYKNNRHIATATVTGHITTCNNVGKGRYVIEVQADKEIKIENVS